MAASRHMVSSINPPDPPEHLLAARRGALRAAGWISAGSWAYRLSVLATLAVLAAKLSPREFGVVGVATLAANVLVNLNDLGFPDALVYQTTRIREAADATLM